MTSESLYNAIYHPNQVWRRLIQRFLTRQNLETDPRQTLRDFYLHKLNSRDYTTQNLHGISKLIAPRLVLAAQSRYEQYIYSYLPELLKDTGATQTAYSADDDDSDVISTVSEYYHQVIKLIARNGTLDIYRFAAELDERFKPETNEVLPTAVIADKRDIVEYIIKAADRNSWEFSYGIQWALINAVNDRNISMTNYLISKGADVNMDIGWNSSAIRCALTTTLNCVKHLLTHGAVLPVDALQETTQNHDKYEDMLDIVKFLVEEKHANLSLTLEDLSLLPCRNFGIIPYLIERGVPLINFARVLAKAVVHNITGTVTFLKSRGLTYGADDYEIAKNELDFWGEDEEAV